MNNSNENLHAILVLSNGSKEYTVADVEGLLADVRAMRKLNGNTGLSVFSHGNVLILIEGEKEKVEAEYEAAVIHESHHSLIKVFDGAMNRRYFPEDSLAFKPLAPEKFKVLDDFSEPEKEVAFRDFLALPEQVPTVVRQFVQNNR